MIPATFPIRGPADNPVVNAQRARDAAGRHLEVHFADESEVITVDLSDGTDADDVAAALVDCLDAPTADDAQGRLQDGLEGRGGTVMRGP
jgi:hypothetical protein